jgi:ATP/maltotriose-dependent transcriptional regulator MalT
MRHPRPDRSKATSVRSVRPSRPDPGRSGKTGGIAHSLDELEQLAVDAFLAGGEDDGVQAWGLAHAGCLEAGDDERAARCAFWLGFGLLLGGHPAQANGWFTRGSRLVGDEESSAARGLLLVPTALGAIEDGDLERAADLASDVLALADRTGDRDVLAFGLLLRGEAELARRDSGAGLAALDEAMVSVTAGELSPIATGIVYCAVIIACMEAFELRRAGEWTAALGAWCDAQPGLVPFRGQCLVHRSQLLQAHGDWPTAVTEADRACAALAEPPHPALGTARYQAAELHRLHGELDAADAAYREAHRLGRDPMPGLALLRLAEGNVAGAVAAIRHAVKEAEGMARPVVLDAAVEILLADRDVLGARVAADELAALAADLGAAVLLATSARALGAVLLAEGDAAAALAELRRAATTFGDVGLPYELARTGVLVAEARRALGDQEMGELERDRAARTFEQLGAHVELNQLDTSATPTPAGRLTGRECEVLRLVARGGTNREIGEALSISQHTVARHLQNVFTKLDLSSRAAATAYAYESGIIDGADGPS